LPHRYCLAKFKRKDATTAVEDGKNMKADIVSETLQWAIQSNQRDVSFLEALLLQ